MEKRYVKEIANDVMKKVSEDKKKEVRRILQLCHSGYLSSLDAVREIIDVENSER